MSLVGSVDAASSDVGVAVTVTVVGVVDPLVQPATVNAMPHTSSQIRRIKYPDLCSRNEGREKALISVRLQKFGVGSLKFKLFFELTPSCSNCLSR